MKKFIHKYKMNILGYCTVGFLLRVGFIGYGEWQDKTMIVKFTDVDYQVFTDASTFVYQGMSPYNRSTYRYTPILAYMLLPNINFSHLFGKILFIACDVLTGYLMYIVLKQQKYSKQQAVIYSCFWLLNPLPIAVSSRGNAESIMTALVLLCLLALMERRVILAAFMYGITVHFKIYPVTFALSIYLYLHESKHTQNERVQDFKTLLFPNRARICFLVVSGLTLSLLTAFFYHLYGWKFLYESYLYHIVRKDIRHNFSPYFYMLYLTAEQSSMLWIKILVFVPQCLLITVFSIKYYTDLPMSWFLITFTFVATNKVCTSQYFLWYLGILPLIMPSIQMSLRRAGLLTASWFIGQALWLNAAFMLEFQGQNTFIWIWLAGLIFVSINFNIIYSFIQYYEPLTAVPEHLLKKIK